MRFAFIAKNADTLPVERLCQIMDVSPRGYRACRNRPLSQSQRKDMVVLAHIREQFALSLGSCGRPPPRILAPADLLLLLLLLHLSSFALLSLSLPLPSSSS